MTFANLYDNVFWAVISASATGFLFILKGGVKKSDAETGLAIVDGITRAGEFLAKSNEDLQKSIVEQTKFYENKINQLVEKFELKEKSLNLKIENLELQNKNLRLENANLALDNDRLIKASRVQETL